MDHAQQNVGASKKNLLFVVYLQRIQKTYKSSFRIVLSSAIL